MKKTAIASIVSAVMFLVALNLASPYVRSPATRQPAAPIEPGDPILAQVVCQKAARAQLKAPATAQFGTVSPVSLGGGRFQVAGPVDAENSYGALLRMTYDCTVHFTGGESYRIEHIALTPP